jgi:hypothetical protein
MLSPKSDYSEVTSTAHREIDKACQLMREQKYEQAWKAFQSLADGLDEVARVAWVKAYERR